MSHSEAPISSPCISICALDEEDICTGCYRTADEIRGWMKMDNGERKAVIRESMKRSRKSNPFA